MFPKYIYFSSKIGLEDRPSADHIIIIFKSAVALEKPLVDL